MEIQVTEHKSTGELNPLNKPVRVFVDRDFDYGYFVPEHELFALLTDAQQQAYLQPSAGIFDVSAEVAQKLIDLGQTPFAKRRVIP